MRDHEPNETHTKRIKISPSHKKVNRFIQNIFYRASYLKVAQILPVLRGGSFLTSYVSHASCEPIKAISCNNALITFSDTAFQCEDVIIVEDIVDTGKTISHLATEIDVEYPGVIEIHVIALASKKKGESLIHALDDSLEVNVTLHSMNPGIDDTTWIDFPWEELDEMKYVR